MSIDRPGMVEASSSGGPATIRQYRRALGYVCKRFVASQRPIHVVLRRQGHNEA
jgi:hypothetical protein